ncbi:MAG: polysulfide reductase NrfD [Bacteroidetes bacterium]|nr:polysulfide reductase NrfD [Bacteroidota bacterium]
MDKKLKEIKETKKNKWYLIIWISLFGILLITGLLTAIRIFTAGHAGMFNTTDEIPWGLPIGTYIFFVLTSSGLTFISSLSSVFRIKLYKPIAKRCVFMAICAMFAGFVSLLIELGQPLNIIYYVITPNFGSQMWWMGALYGIYLLFLITKFWRLHIGDHDSMASKALGLVTLFFAIAAPAILGSIFGLVVVRPAFLSEFKPAYFLLTALLSGLAFLMLIRIIYHFFVQTDITENRQGIFNHIAELLALTIGITIFFSVWRTITGLNDNRTSPAFFELVSSWPFRIEVFLGLVFPFFLMIVPSIRQTDAGKTIASLFVLGGLFIGRIELIMVGQIQPMVHGITEADKFTHYFPSVWEWIIAGFSLSILLLLYAAGERYLNLDIHPVESKITMQDSGFLKKQ